LVRVLELVPVMVLVLVLVPVWHRQQKENKSPV
jgi:hypothetical protein